MFQKIWNSAVAWSFGVTALRTGGFLLVLPLVLRALPPEELGFWYVLLGLMQAANHFELGFASTIGRFASYFMGGAASIPTTGLPAKTMENAPSNFGGIANLVASAEKLYRWLGIAIGTAFLVLGGGWLAWRYPETMSSPKAWPAFGLLGLGTGFAMSQYFWGAVLAGMNQVREQQRIFFVGLMLNYAVVLSGILLGFGIFSLVAGQLVLGLVPRSMARARVRQLIPRKTVGTATKISWQNLWPTTWRNYLVGFCAYLLLPATSLVCAGTTSLAITAQYGLSLQFGLMLHGLSATWQAVKYPQVAALLAAGRADEIRLLVRRRLGLSLLTFAVGALLIMALGPLFLQASKSQTAFLPPGTFALLLVAVAMDLWSGSFSALLQTTNRAPHLPWFGIAAGIGFPLGFFLGGTYGPSGIIAACILAQVAFCVWTAPRLWRRELQVIQAAFPQS